MAKKSSKRRRRTSTKTATAAGGESKPPSEADLKSAAQASRKLLEHIHEHSEQTTKLLGVWEDLKKRTSDAKKEYDTSLAALLSLTTARDEPALLRRMDPLGWRNEPITDVFKSSADAEMVRQACAPNGKLSKLCSWLERHRFEEIKGVGPEKAAKLNDELALFWKKNPQWVADS